MTSDEPTYRWEAVAAASAAVAVWMVAHFLVFVPDYWWSATFEGEWDLLLTARAVAAGSPPRAAVGTIHGFEIGSYFTAAGAGGFLAMGMSPTVASRWMAALVGAGGLAVAAGGVHWLARTNGHRPRVATALTIALGAFCWPHWHFLNLGVTGTTLEASVILVLASMFVLSPVRSNRRALMCGLFLGLGLLYSPLALAAAPPLLFLVLYGGTGPLLPRVMALAGGVFGAALMAALILPGGVAALVNVGWFLKGIVPAVFEPSSTLGPVAGPNVLVRAIHVYVPSGFFPVDVWTTPAIILGLAGPIAALWLAVRGDEVGRRLGGLTLFWLGLLCLLFLKRGSPETFRYWSVYALLGLLSIGYCLATWSNLWKSVLFVGPALALLLALLAPRTLPPPGRSTLEVMTTLGGHRTPQRLGVRPGMSDRHGTFIDLLPYVPVEYRPAFAQGYGLDIADDLSVPGMIDWWPEWDLGLLKPHVPNEDWQSFLLGVGCGLTVQPVLNQERLEILHDAEPESLRYLGLGIGLCILGDSGVIRQDVASLSRQLPVSGWEACASKPGSSGPSTSSCAVQMEAAVPRLWAFSNPSTGP